jgi:4-amino-4-deoxy-L-arabinose transferase-like glycosyltransferase
MLAACLVLLPLLGHKPLANWDEGIYAEVSREMASHGWLVTFWNQEVWLEKPPLMLWITAVFFRIFGVNEFWARAGSALSGVALVGLLHGWLQKRDTLKAWLSTLILLGTFGFLRVCRVGEMDALLSLGCCIALIGLTQVDEGAQTGWYLFWIGFAAATMTKGAAAVVLLLSMVGVALLFRWGMSYFSRLFWLGLSLFLLFTLPWHLAMFHLFGRQFLSDYLGLQVWSRATRKIEGHDTHWWYYFKVLLVSAAPFVLVYPLAWFDSLQKKQVRVWAIFSAVVPIFFTFVQTRLPQYVAPMYPALAVLVASYLGDRLRPFIVEHRPPSFWIKLTLAGVAVSAAAISVTSTARRGLHSGPSAASASLRDSDDSIPLLRDVFRHAQPIGGPLLVWRSGYMPITTDIFYSRREVQQVQLLSVASGTPTNRYTFDPKPLASVVASDPRLILLDKSLIPHVPGGFLYMPIESGRTVEVGLIVRAPKLTIASGLRSTSHPDK